MGMVSATQQFVRSLGGIVVAPILGTVLVTIFSTQLATLMPAQLQSAIHTLPPAQQEALLNPQGLINAETQAAIESSFIKLGENGSQLYQQFITAVHQALTDGTTRLFTVGTVFAVLAFLATFGLKELELQQDEFFQQQKESANILD
jgi:hypothetical protein